VKGFELNPFKPTVEEEEQAIKAMESFMNVFNQNPKCASKQFFSFFHFQKRKRKLDLWFVLCFVKLLYLILSSLHNQYRVPDLLSIGFSLEPFRLFKLLVCQLIIGQMEKMMNYFEPFIKTKSVYQHNKGIHFIW
jgi:hypothetical protein